jgi:hypothetical protein
MTRGKQVPSILSPATIDKKDAVARDSDAIADIVQLFTWRLPLHQAAVTH